MISTFDVNTEEKNRDWYKIAVGLLLFQITLMILVDYLLMDDALYYDFWQDQFSFERIEKMISDGKNWRWVSYVFTPLFLLFKCFLISSCIYVGAFLHRSDKTLADFFRIALLAQFVALLPILVKIIWFGFIHRDYGLKDVAYFSPLSVLSLFDIREVESWLIYPFQLLSIFELLYWLVLAYLLKDVLNKNYLSSLGFVASTYGIGIFIWTLLITFMIVSVT